MPFFVWFNTIHTHLRTHPKPESVGQAGRWQSPYHDTMIDHDKVVGALLDKLDQLEITENTIVIYSTDNGPHMNTWPDGAMTPFRSEKHTNWEGAFRVLEIVGWHPGHTPDLGRAVCRAARPQAVQPSRRPFERADVTSNTYYDWVLDNTFIILAASTVVGEFLNTFESSRRRSTRPASRSIRRWRSCRTR